MKNKLWRPTCKMVSRCHEAVEHLKVLTPNHHLLWVSLYTDAGNKWLTTNFYPKGEEVTSDKAIDMLRMWVNFYTAVYLTIIRTNTKHQT